MPKQYFQMFPKIAYDIDGDANNFKVVTDVMRRVRVKMQELSDKVIYDRYSMQDGETIESVAYKFYGSPTYHWVLLLLNNIIDPIHGLVLDGNKFNDHLKSNYGLVQNTVLSSLAVARWDVDLNKVDQPCKVIAGGDPVGPGRPKTSFYIPEFSGDAPGWSAHPYYKTPFDVPGSAGLKIYQHGAKTTTYWFSPGPGSVPSDSATIPPTVTMGDILTFTFPYVWWNPAEDKLGYLPKLAYGVKQKVIYLDKFSITTDLDSRALPELDLDDTWIQTDGSDVVTSPSGEILPRLQHDSNLKLGAGQGGLNIFTNLHHFDQTIYNTDGSQSGTVSVSADAYENPNVNLQYGVVSPISIFEYESDLNDTKRNILILRKDLLSSFISEFETLIAR